MKLISEIEIDHFRSIKSDRITGLGDFTAFAGLNNSGKSNVLRALHAFFTNKTDANVPLSIDTDYYRHDLKKKKKAKRIRIAIKFNLPLSFKFRKGLEDAQKFLGGATFKITKEWRRDYASALYYLNDLNTPLDLDSREKVDQFLSLISFRYIPNRVLPLDIIRSEHQALRDVLVRRLASKAKNQAEVFEAIRSTSSTLIASLERNVHDACQDVGKIRLATPTSWQDMIFAFGYKLGVNDVEIDDSAQGSGIQSLLMLETLSLIDRDYFQKFGWKQAAVWALEEPESSMHSSLEARISSYLASISTDASSRLQILSTTHSDLVLQHADHAVFVTMNHGTTSFEIADKRTVLQKSANLGISRWIHPILANPLNPIVLVEGKFDYAFIDKALKVIKPDTEIRVAYLEQLQGGNVTGGVDELLKYIKSNVNAIKTRAIAAPIIVVLDWDAGKKKGEFEKVMSKGDAYKVLVWPDTTFNPNLGKAFHGIERHIPDRIVDEADANVRVLGTKADGSRTVSREDYRKFKDAVHAVVTKGLSMDDLIYARPFIEELAKLEK